MKKIIILLSGAGSTAKYLIENLPQDIDISLIISDNPEAGGLNVAHDNNIPISIISPKDFNDRDEFDDGIVQVVQNEKPDLVVLAGFMLVLGENYTDAIPNTINVHPSLPGKHLGSVNGIQDSWNDDSDEGGSIVHMVTSVVDGGKILGSTLVQKRNHTFETFKKAVMDKEKELLLNVIIQQLNE